MKFVIIPELKGRWRWELRRPNGVAFFQSALQFANQSEAINDVINVRLSTGDAPIFDLIGQNLEVLQGA